ncbi:MAG: hypothetical protein HFH35_11320 [Eubacterium sp.]|nr:hypothetical protein [Eubacterium sp.]
MKYLLCAVYIIFSILGLTFMKLGSMGGRQAVFQIMQMKFTLYSMAGYLCYLSSFLVYTCIITKFDLSYIIPFLGGVVNILIFIIGVFLFQEKATGYSVAGCVLVAAGVVLMNMK